MLAMVAMEDPKGITAKHIREARKSVLACVRPYSRNIKDTAYRAQYEGYNRILGIDPKTQTETFFKLKLSIDNSKWKDVPFYLESGKSLDRDLVEISITFKDKESSSHIVTMTNFYSKTGDFSFLCSYFINIYLFILIFINIYLF